MSLTVARVAYLMCPPICSMRFCMEPCWGADTQKHSSVGEAGAEVEGARQEIWGKQSK